MALPELPEPFDIVEVVDKYNFVHNVAVYDAYQMRAYGRACVDAAHSIPADMVEKSESTVELLKRALDRKFSGEPVSYVSFQGNHLKVDLKGFLSSTAGRTALKAEVESVKRVPLTPVRKIVTAILARQMEQDKKTRHEAK